MSDVVSTSATTYPITLADLKRHVNVSTTLDDQILTDYLAAATQYAEDVTNRRYCTETRILKMHGFDDERYVHDRVIYPPKAPLGSVTSIVYVNTTGGNSTLSTTAYSVSTGDAPGAIHEAYNDVWPTPRDQADNVTITYTVGYGSTQAVQPDNVKQAIRLQAGHYYRNREAATESQSNEIAYGVETLLGQSMLPDYG